MALAAYRQILRSIPIAFGGDKRLLLGAQHEARRMFEQNLRISDQEEVRHKIEHARAVARILRENVVQGEGLLGEDHYRLRIHAETEKGDNESIKMNAACRTSRS